VSVAKGALAGAAGTLAMDLVWYRRYRAGGGDRSFSEWEFTGTVKSWDEASAPGQLGKRLLKVVANVDLPPSAAGLTSNVVHWATGMQWGVLLGLALGRGRAHGPAATVVSGVALGASAFAASYVVLPLVGLYKPIWEYDAETVAKDLSAHLVYGSATSLVFRALSRR
jgi:hypothetical protein